MSRSWHGIAPLGRASLGIGLLGLLGLASCGPDAEPPAAPPPAPEGTVRLTPAQMEAAELRVATVELTEIAPTIQVPGSIMTPDTAMAQVGSVVEGQVETVRVLPGDEVSAGQELLRIRSHDLTQALRDQRAAEAQATFSQAALERSQELFAAGALSKEEVQRRQAHHEEVAADLARSRERVRALSPSEDGQVVVRAPRDGTIFEVAVKPGSAVLIGSPLADLGRTDILWATGWVPEKEAVRLLPGDTVRVRFQALPEEVVLGRVVRMGGVVDPTRRAVEVRAELSRIPQGVRPGVFAILEVPSGASVPRAVLPSDAVIHTPSGDLVFLAEGDGIFRPLAVDVVVLADGNLAVTGLPAGATVVVEGAYAVRSAMETASLAQEEVS